MTKKPLKLTKEQSDKLWGVDGPYSEARLIFNSRILDDAVSRIFIEVEVAINPLTFEIIKANRHEFADDEVIQQLLDDSDYRGQAHGYVSSAFCIEHTSPEDIDEANLHLEYAEAMIIRMHKWVMRYLDPSIN